MIRNHKPATPDLVRTCDQIAAASAHELMPHERNISDNTQLYRPRAYSLTTRQEGSNSGLNTCRLASRRIVEAASMTASQAAGILIFDGSAAVGPVVRLSAMTLSFGVNRSAGALS
jgi:hypothetical protein